MRAKPRENWGDMMVRLRIIHGELVISTGITTFKRENKVQTTISESLCNYVASPETIQVTIIRCARLFLAIIRSGRLLLTCS